MPRNLFWALPLLLITEGHMSGSVSYLTFEQIIRWSDAIVLARKVEPHVIYQDESVGEKTWPAPRTISSTISVQTPKNPERGREPVFFC
jgi:hypothetical protein